MHILLQEDGKLPAYAWPGGYPMFYLDGDNCVLCPKCANQHLKNDIESFRPVVGDVNWEDEGMICEQCNEVIEAAYTL